MSPFFYYLCSILLQVTVFVTFIFYIMRKILLLITAVVFSFSASAQTVEESKILDNVYFGVNGGVATKATGVHWMDNLNPNAGVRIGKWITPVV